MPGKNSPRPIVISGPSGAGKSTVMKRLLADHPELFGFSVSHTTRKPRPGEQHGVDYYFTTRDEMERMIANEEFIETAEFSGNLYGTSKKAILEVMTSNRICILDIEKAGCESVRRSDLNAKFIQIRPPSIEVLEERLRARKTETDDSLRRRLEEAVESMEYGAHPGNFHHIIINTTVDEAYVALRVAVGDDIAHARSLTEKGADHDSKSHHTHSHSHPHSHASHPPKDSAAAPTSESQSAKAAAARPIATSRSCTLL